MKKILCQTILSLGLFGVLFSTPSYAANNTDLVKESTEVIQKDGWDIEITTKEASYEEFLELQEQKNQEVFGTPIIMSRAAYTYKQNDHLFGSGTKTVSGLTGTVWTNDLFIGLNATSGVLQGTVYAYSSSSKVKSTPRVELTTWDAVGGTLGIVKEYVLKNSSLGTGTVTKVINQNLSGAIAYYSISLYGDHVSGTTEFTSNAQLKKK